MITGAIRMKLVYRRFGSFLREEARKNIGVEKEAWCSMLILRRMMKIEDEDREESLEKGI